MLSTCASSVTSPSSQDCKYSADKCVQAYVSVCVGVFMRGIFVRHGIGCFRTNPLRSVNLFPMHMCVCIVVSKITTAQNNESKE